jgi:hypothetical protein
VGAASVAKIFAKGDEIDQTLSKTRIGKPENHRISGRAVVLDIGFRAGT